MMVQTPKSAHGDRILSSLAPARKLPEPVYKIAGPLPDTEQVRFGLDLRPGQSGWGV
jgi:hypothetical protein